MQKLKNEIVGLLFELAAVLVFTALLYLITLIF
jgi:hypothetical protein